MDGDKTRETVCQSSVDMVVSPSPPSSPAE